MPRARGLRLARNINHRRYHERAACVMRGLRAPAYQNDRTTAPAARASTRAKTLLGRSVNQCYQHGAIS